MDTYYLLLDKDSSKVSLGWKVMQLLCLISIGFSGFWAAYCMGRLLINFGQNCFLFAHLDFLRNDTDYATIRRMYPAVEELPSVTAINLHTSKWGSRSVCYFCQFTPLMSSIYALIWSVLFVLCTKGGVGHISDIFSRPWRIVYPALLFGAFSAVFMFVSAIQLNNGSQVFCAQFVKVLNKTRCFNDIDKYTSYFSVHQKSDFLETLIACIASSNICCISWIIYVVILGLRIICVADFQLISVEVVSRRMSKHGLTLIPTSETTPQNMVATPESMSDDIEKQTGTQGVLRKGRSPTFKTDIVDERTITRVKEWASPSLSASQSDFNLLDVHSEDVKEKIASSKKRVTIYGKIESSSPTPRSSRETPNNKTAVRDVGPPTPTLKYTQTRTENPTTSSDKTDAAATERPFRVVPLSGLRVISEETGPIPGQRNKGVNTETTFGGYNSRDEQARRVHFGNALLWELEQCMQFNKSLKKD